MFLKLKNAGSVVGLAFADDAIRAVALREGAMGAVQVEQIVHFPLPPGALVDRGIGDVDLMIESVKSVLADMPQPIRSVVIGLPSRSTLAHALTVPPVNAKEQRAIVRGEIALLNLLPAGQEAFDFQVFRRPDDAPITAKEAAQKGDAAFFFAAEQHLVEQFRASVAASNIPAIVIEPGEYAAVRIACRALEAKPHSVAISLGAHHTYLQFFRNGQPVYARRLDTGSDQIVAEQMKAQQTDGRAALGGISAEPEPEPEPAPGWQLSSLLAPGMVPEAPAEPAASEPAPGVPTFFNPTTTQNVSTARERLMIDIVRSLDYFGREFRLDMADLDIVLLPNDPAIADLATYAAQQLEQSVDTINIDATALSFPATPLLEQVGGMEFGAALGLALGQMPGPWASVGLIDLGRDSAEAARARRAPRILIAACAGGLAFLAAGVGISNFIEQQAAPVRSELDGDKAALASMGSEEQKLRADTSQQAELVRQIRMKNLPWTNILSNVSQAVPDGVALTNLTIQNGALSIVGETTQPSHVVIFWSRMNGSTFFSDANVTSIQQDVKGTTFQMTASLPAQGAGAATPLPKG